ncbi:MAG: VOC family protein [Thalassovita sp.]
MTPKPIVVWSEIPVTDMTKAMAFYSSVFGFKLTLDSAGPNPIAVFNGAMDMIGGHLYPGKPAEDGRGTTLHLAVPDTLEEAAERCSAAGGEIISDPVPLPIGRFMYIKDPDGNSIGLFQSNLQDTPS